MEKVHAEKRMLEHQKIRAAEKNDEKHENEGNDKYWKVFVTSPKMLNTKEE